MQLLALLKPDGTLRRAAGAGVLQGLLDSKICRLLTFKQIRVPVELVERHYEHIRGRSFYPWLVEYITGGPSYLILVETEKENIAKLRDLLGATRAQEAQPGTLRYRYAPFGGANCIHLSDSEEAASFEVPLWSEFFRVKAGDYDEPIEEYIARYMESLNQTKAIRQLCRVIALDGRPIKGENREQLLRLVSSECVDATPEEASFVAQVIEGAVLS